MLVVLVPTVMLTVIGILMLSISHEAFPTLIFGVLILTLCTSGITGYILGTIFLGKGASLVRVQNDFVSAISHELRTPVTSLRLLIESLQTGRLEDAEIPPERALRALQGRSRAIAATVGRMPAHHRTLERVLG